jgi:hypothetical protein
MAQNIFTVANFEFPYDYKFPGQASDEHILFVTRENLVMLWVRLTTVVLAAVVLFGVGSWLVSVVGSFSLAFGSLLQIFTILSSLAFGIVGWWWVTVMWQKSICIVTTKRLTKFIYTTPFNRHNLSVPLEMIVDTGSYTKGLIQAIFRLGTFMARSAAAGTGIASDEQESGGSRRLNRKYFFIENIAIAEDLQHYVTKLLFAHRHHHARIDTFRPFIPHLKGTARKEFMQQYPDYWS